MIKSNPMKERIEFHTTAREKAAFAKACRANDESMSRVLRRMMKEYAKTKRP